MGTCREPNIPLVLSLVFGLHSIGSEVVNWACMCSTRQYINGYGYITFAFGHDNNGLGS